MTVGIAKWTEPALHRAFGSVGTLTATRPYLITSAVVVFLVALSMGLFTQNVENNLNDLLIADRGRIDGEKKFFDDNFELISPVLNSVIVTPKPGVDILSDEAFDEVYSLQKAIREYTFLYKGKLNVSLEQFCFRQINADPTEPCYQSSILESFQEGAVFNVGGELNTNYAVLFAAKPSYQDFDFNTSFSRSFIAATNLNPDSLMLGDFEVDPTDMNTITSVKALQIAFGAKAPKSLQRDGLQYFEWIEQTPEPGNSNEFCPDVSQCEACADALQPTQFAAAGCTFDGSPSQSDSCCAALGVVRSSPCIEVVFERRAEVGPIANPLFAACDLDIVEVSPRCNNRELYVDSTTENQSDGNPLCTCLGDSTSATCTEAVGAYLQENPEQADLFTNAAAGDETAAEQVGAFLVTEFGCEAPAPTEPSTDTEPVATQEATTDSEAPATYQAKVTVIHSETDTIQKAKDVMHEWEKAWREHMWDEMKRFKYINVDWFTSTSLDDEVELAAKAEADLMVLGYALVLIYLVTFCTFDWKIGNLSFTRLPPGPTISILCLLSVILSVVAAMGVAGYISELTRFKISFITIQMLPLLMVGLGINDFFVLVSALKSVLLREDCPTTTAGVMYEMMAVGGTSITLSSAANLCAFSLGTLSPVPVVLWFSVHMAIAVFIAYIISLAVIPSLLSISVSRYLAGKPDFILSLFGAGALADPTNSTEPVQGKKEGVVAAFIRKYRWILTAGVVAFFAVWAGFGTKGIIHFEQGVDFTKAVTEDSYPYNFLKSTDKYFDTNQLNIVFRDSVDYSVAEEFQSARKAEFDFVNEAYRVEKLIMTVSWMEFYTQYVESKFCANEVCMNEVNWYYDGFSSSEFGHPSKNICSEAETAEECENICQTHCPQGPVDSEFRCQYQEGTTQCYCPYRPMLKSRYFYENPPEFDSKIQSYWSDFLANTSFGLAARVFINLDPDTVTMKNPLGVPKATRSYVFTRGLQDIPHQLKHIKSGRRALDRQDVDVYPFDFVIYGQGDQYDEIALTTVRSVGICMAVATVVMMPLIAHWFAAFIVAVCVCFAVFLAAGTSSWTTLQLDYAVYVALIVSVGLSIEFCAHITRDFMMTPGDRLTRVLHALRTMGVAVLNGGITTFLGILPSAISKLPSIRDRLFLQYSCVVAAGMLVGLLLLPIVLSFVGPPAYTEENSRKEADEENQGTEKKEVELN